MYVFSVGPHPPYIPLLETSMFTGDTIKRLNASGKINGLMVIHTSTSNSASYPSHFSSDRRCPNERSSIYADDTQLSCSKFKFNPEANELLFVDLKMPLALLTSQVEVDRALNCYFTHNIPLSESDSVPPLCSAELRAVMNGAGNTEICMRRNNIFRNLSPWSYCDPLGGYSSLAFLHSTESTQPRDKTIVIVTRTDTFSLFENVSPGTSSPVSSLTVLFAIAETLNQVAIKEELLSSGYNVLFLALSGESFDYIGSQKLVYDMRQGFFPNSSYEEARMNLEDIDILIELSQLIDAFGTRQIYAHVDPLTSSKHPAVKQFIDSLQEQAFSLTVKTATVDQPLPPSSAQMFLRENEDGLPVVVLADYDSNFSSSYYNSYLDTPESHQFYLNRSIANNTQPIPKAIFLANIVTTISRSIFSYATGKNATFVSNSSTTNDLLYCFLVSRQCALLYATIGTDNIDILENSPAPLPLYVSVYRSYGITQNFQLVVKQLLAYYTGVDVTTPDMDYSECVKNKTNVYISGFVENGTRKAMCIQSSAQYHNASSPAFEIENYNFTSPKFSTWTESVWSSDAFRVRLFLKPSAEVELASMIAGISIFIISAIVVVLLHRRAAVLFPLQMENAQILSNDDDGTT